MKNKRVFAIFLFIIFLLTLGGCRSTSAVQVEEEAPVQPVQEEKIVSIDVNFAGRAFKIPYDMAMFHSPNSMKTVKTDMEELFLDLKGQSNDVVMLRSGQLTSAVTETADADYAMQQFNKPEYFDSVDVVLSDAELHELFYVQFGVTVTLDEKTYSLFTMIPKGSNEIYSIAFLSNRDGTPLCSIDDTKILLGSLQTYTGAELKKDYFYEIFRRFLTNQAKELYKYKAYDSVPVLADEQGCELEPETSYYLDLETGLYTLETIEGEGDITVEDSRFGTRVMLLGYDSANAPITLPNVTLVHGGGIRTNMGLKIRIVK